MRNFAHTGKRNPWGIVTKFCMSVDIQDVITCATFGDDRLRGLGVARGRISHFPIDLRHRPYNTLALRASVWCGFGWPPATRSRDTAHVHCQFWHYNGPFILLSSITQQLEAKKLAVSMVRWISTQIQCFRFKRAWLRVAWPMAGVTWPNFEILGPFITFERIEIPVSNLVLNSTQLNSRGHVTLTAKRDQKGNKSKSI